MLSEDDSGRGSEKIHTLILIYIVLKGVEKYTSKYIHTSKYICWFIYLFIYKTKQFASGVQLFQPVSNTNQPVSEKKKKK